MPAGCHCHGVRPCQSESIIQGREENVSYSWVYCLSRYIYSNFSPLISHSARWSPLLGCTSLWGQRHNEIQRYAGDARQAKSSVKFADLDIEKFAGIIKKICWHPTSSWLIVYEMFRHVGPGRSGLIGRTWNWRQAPASSWCLDMVD